MGDWEMVKHSLSSCPHQESWTPRDGRPRESVGVGTSEHLVIMEAVN